MFTGIILFCALYAVMGYIWGYQNGYAKAWDEADKFYEQDELPDASSGA